MIIVNVLVKNVVFLLKDIYREIIDMLLP